MPIRIPAKKALLVAVHSTSQRPLGKVPGAHNDLKKMWSLLTDTYKYKPEDITVMLDSKKVDPSSKLWPTKKNMLEAMRNLVAGSQAGDHIVFSFSGHGDQAVPTKDKNERDGKDEILLPCDYDVTGRHNGINTEYTHFIRDDEIREIFVDQLTEGIHCTLVFDCCHSGTACDLPEVEAKDVYDEGERISLPKSRAPGFAKNETLHHGHAANAKESGPNMVGRDKAGRDLVKKVTSWSACSDMQVTFGNVNGGLFIDAFVSTLHSANGPKKITHGDFLLALRAKLVEDTTKMLKKDIRDAPLPQLGSLRPDRVLTEPFFL